MAATQAQIDALAKGIVDPRKFARLLGHDPWETAEAIMQSVATCPRTVVKSCHASSKSFTAAELAVWWVMRYPDGKVITTAPTFTQVKEVLWPEIRHNVEDLRAIFPSLPAAHQVSWKIGAQRYSLGFSTDRGVRFQGFHGRILIILDEAAGVRADIYPAIEGIRAGGEVQVLAIGNPSSPSGPFFDAFTVNRSMWRSFTIHAFSAPNFVDETNPERHITLDEMLAMRDKDRLKVAPRPYLVTREWVLEKYDEWGPGSPLWQTKVEGAF